MGIGEFVDKAKDMAADNKDTVKDGIEKAADVVDDKTGGKFSDQVDKGADAAKDAVDNLADDE
ncbi:MAG: antitoxin [Acidimicrobiia bacterium]